MRIAVIDLETDPFEYGQMVWPFVAGYYDGHEYRYWWGKDCVAQSVDYLATVKPSIIYAHNGGRFDFFYYVPYLRDSLRIVNGRIISAKLGHHEVRDSFAIMPFALESYKKTAIDYSKFKRKIRDNHRDEIVSYLRDDCIDLHTLCVAFQKEFGNILTVGSAAMKQLKKFHTFATGNQEYDEKLRHRFYFGGRNQCFRTGIVRDRIRVYDVNSMYPYAMRDFLHPVSVGIYRSKRIDERTCFLEVEGRNRGAFPVRTKTGGLDFTIESGVFTPTIHEFNTALDTGTFTPTRILETIGYKQRETFGEFVTHFYDARQKAEAEGDKIRKLFYKFVLNSAYGKFAQNPANYCDWFICQDGEFPPDWHQCGKACQNPCRLRWTPTFNCNEYIIWSRPLQQLNFFNVATGSSITGASRAVLLKGLSRATNPLYCDTDSIIATDLQMPQSETELGAWKLEATGNCAAICGKKLYAIWDGSTAPIPNKRGETDFIRGYGNTIKKAHKGGRLTGSEILRIARGETVESFNPVPTFKWTGDYSFTHRKMKRTA